MPRTGSYRPDLWNPTWKAVRLEVLARDNYECQIRGPRCKGRANSVDHIIPPSEGGSKYGLHNLRAACTPCNSGRKEGRRQERWRQQGGGVPKITLVAGPPSAGHSEWLAEHRAPGTVVVVNPDALAVALGAEEGGVPSGGVAKGVGLALGGILGGVRRGEVPASEVVLISTDPRSITDWPHHELVELVPPFDVVRARLIERWGSEEGAAIDLATAKQWYQGPVARRAGQDDLPDHVRERGWSRDWLPNRAP